MGKVYGVRCDRCGEVLSAPSASKLASLINECGWYSGKYGRSTVHYCGPCQEASEALRQAIIAKLRETVGRV